MSALRMCLHISRTSLEKLDSQPYLGGALQTEQQLRRHVREVADADVLEVAAVADDGREAQVRQLRGAVPRQQHVAAFHVPAWQI